MSNFRLLITPTKVTKSQTLVTSDPSSLTNLSAFVTQIETHLPEGKADLGYNKIIAIKGKRVKYLCTDGTKHIIKGWDVDPTLASNLFNEVDTLLGS